MSNKNWPNFFSNGQEILLGPGKSMGAPSLILNFQLKLYLSQFSDPDPHYGEPPGSVSAWRDGDPDPHGEMRIRIRMELLAELDKDPYNNR